MQNKNKQKQTKTNKNKQKQTKTNKNCSQKTGHKLQIHQRESQRNDTKYNKMTIKIGR